jgi:hypothetical protein
MNFLEADIKRLTQLNEKQPEASAQRGDYPKSGDDTSLWHLCELPNVMYRCLSKRTPFKKFEAKYLQQARSDFNGENSADQDEQYFLLGNNREICHCSTKWQ